MERKCKAAFRAVQGKQEAGVGSNESFLPKQNSKFKRKS